MAYIEFHETMYEKYAKAEERRRRWIYAIRIAFLLFAAIVLALIAFCLTR